METAWRIRIEPRWGTSTIGDIRPTAVEDWFAKLAAAEKPVGASVLKRTHHVLAGILADAVRDKRIVANPAAGVKLKRPGRKRPVYLSHDQVTDLSAAAGEHEGLILMLAYTGLRWGEAVGMRVRDVDVARRRASVAEHAVQSGGRINVGTPKAHKQRTVPLPEFLLPYLERQCEGKDGGVAAMGRA